MGLFLGSNHLNGGGEAGLVTSRKDALANKLRADIREGRLKPGEHLPTEKELAASERVSVNTVRAALQSLVYEGLIERRRRHGTIVKTPQVLVYTASRAEPSRLSASDRADAFFAEVRAQGRIPTQRFEFHDVLATPDLATPLCVPEGSPLILRRLLRLVDGRPVALQDSYYPGDIADRCQLRVTENIPEGTIARMLAHGVEEIAWLHDNRSRNPTPDEATVLQLGDGVSLMINLNLVGARIHDPDDPERIERRLVRLTRTLFDGSSTNLRYELGKLEEIYDAFPQLREYLP
jgi:GntR family transcriptional regulator